MCGIVGCVGHNNAVGFVADGLETLEYRGYDSCGLAYPGEDNLEVKRALGVVDNLRSRIPDDASRAQTAIGHTRWATHGGVAIDNTHPHTDAEKQIAIVHNGVIENHGILRQELIDGGYNFRSKTDTEVIPHLLDYYLKEKGSPELAFKSALGRLVGAYAVLACFEEEPDSIYAARVGSPLVLGLGDHEAFAASDPSVLAGNTDKVIFLEDHEAAILKPDDYKIMHLKNGTNTTRQPENLEDTFEAAELGDFPHYMIKEIHDSPEVIRAAISGRVLPERGIVRLGGLESKKEEIKRIERLLIVACGTSYHAGLVGERLIEEVAGIPVEVQLASEFKYRSEPFEHGTAILAISQSGETSDTIGALEKAAEFGMPKLGVINTPGSTIDRLTDAGVHCRAGKEVSVASTKAFTSQVAVLAEIAMSIGNRSSEHKQELMEELVNLPQKIEEILEDTTAIQEAAKKYSRSKNFLYIGRGYEHASALEGALKLKEISYIHAEGCGAGEMKHGTLALIDEDFPTFAIATYGSVFDKTASNIEEIKARNGPVIALATKGNKKIQDMVDKNKIDDVIYVPNSLEQTQPILNGIAMQLFAYYVAVEKGLNVDRPRNLAKSVTVE